MKQQAGGTAVVATMAFLVMLGAGVVIPAVRPMFASIGASESQMHAFMSVNMIGAAVGAPLLGAWADRRRIHRALVIALAVADAALLFATTLHVGVGALLALRVLQGATNVGVLSITLGAIATAGRSHARAAGVGGSAVMVAVAIGPAVGGALLRLGPMMPVRFASGLALAAALVAVLCGAPLSSRGERPRTSESIKTLLRDPHLVVPAALAFAERFTVGCFVVTFALYAHEVRHLTDTQTALSYSLFLVPFAVATYPLARARRLSRATMLFAGGIAYGVTFLTFGVTSGLQLAAALVVAGASSAMVYAPSLCFVAAAGAGGKRATAMAVFHAAGCLGMMLGPAVAGIASAILRRAGTAAQTRYALIFVIGGVAQLVTMKLLAGRIHALRTSERDVGQETTTSPA